MSVVGNWIPQGADADVKQRLTAEFRNLVQTVKSAMALATSLAGEMGQMAPSTDVTTIETYLNIPTGSGQAAKDQVGTVNTALQNGGNGFLGLVQRFG